jgi:hypothetical protein
MTVSIAPVMAGANPPHLLIAPPDVRRAFNMPPR